MIDIIEERFVPVTIKPYCSRCGSELRKEDLSYLFVSETRSVARKHLRRFRYVCPNCGGSIYSDTDYPRVEYHRIKLKAPAAPNGGAR